MKTATRQTQVVGETAWLKPAFGVSNAGITGDVVAENTDGLPTYRRRGVRHIRRRPRQKEGQEVVLAPTADTLVAYRYTAIAAASPA